MPVHRLSVGSSIRWRARKNDSVLVEFELRAGEYLAIALQSELHRKS